MLFASIVHMLYDWPTWLIAVGLFCAMFLANEAGFRYGHRYHRQESEVSRTVAAAFKGSVFGLVALLLAFSFSATTSRHELRQRLVLDQANAIGTCYLRAGLLGDPWRERIREILRRYVALRLEHAGAGSDQTAAELDRLLSSLWEEVEGVDRKDPEAVRISMIVPAANDVIDLSSTRSWASRNHLPDPVLALLLSSVLVSSALLGHSSGQAGVRHLGLWLAMNLIFVLILYVVLDFDRPQRGLIRVDQTPLVELSSSIGQPSAR